MRNLTNLITTPKVRVITLLGLVLALVGVVAFTPPFAQAQTTRPLQLSDDHSLVVREATDAEAMKYASFTLAHPPQDTPFTDEDVIPAKGILMMELTVPSRPSDVFYILERRAHFDDGSIAGWQVTHVFQVFHSDPPQSTLLDTTVSPGVKYEYRVQKNVSGNAAGYIYGGPPMLMPPQGYAYGHGTANGARIIIRERPDHPDWQYRVTRYPGSPNVGGTSIGTVTTETTVDDTVAHGIYRYAVEYVQDVDGEWVFAAKAADVIVKVDGSALAAPTGLDVDYYPRHGSPTYGDWNTITSTHPANILMYELLSRDFRDPASIYQPVGTTRLGWTVEYTGQKNQQYQYAVRAVAWDQSRGPLSDPVTTPDITTPMCGDSPVQLEAIKLGYPELPPQNVRHTFMASFTQVGDVPAECRHYLDEVFVERRALYKHIADPSCGAMSCDLVGGTSGNPTTGWLPMYGKWVPGTEPESVWYDAPNTNTMPGLYRYEYRVCSYHQPGLCGQYVMPWEFEEVDEIPLTTAP